MSENRKKTKSKKTLAIRIMRQSIAEMHRLILEEIPFKPFQDGNVRDTLIRAEDAIEISLAVDPV
jgi:hypothetical protein